MSSVVRALSVESEPAAFDLLEHRRRDRPASARFGVLDVPLDAIVQGRFAPQAVLRVPEPIERLFRQLRHLHRLVTASPVRPQSFLAHPNMKGGRRQPVQWPNRLRLSEHGRTRLIRPSVWPSPPRPAMTNRNTQ